MKPLSLATLVLLTAWTAGCMGDQNPLATSDVSATDNQFTPNRLDLVENERVSWTNDGQLDHTVTIHKVGRPVTESDKDTVIAPGSSTEHSFTESGTYHVYCRYHSGGTAGDFSTGMVMTVNVTEGA